ncbi:MAG: Crp/Fnr family transcriptional regulator, partial [Elusimicrobia bacterium]|nr:Crp/Fnr family transcriptional regulator [Elusimicrobiota bacterium]
FLYFWQTGERKKIEDKCILKTGDKTSDLFYIISGRVHLSRNGEKVAELEGGDFIAEPALFPEKNVKIDACASGDVEYRVFTADVLDSLSRLNPATYSNLARILGRYMTATLRNALGKEGFNKISEN